MALFIGLFLTLFPAVGARADVQDASKNSTQTIVYEGEVYELYKVEKLPTAVFYLEGNGAAIRTEREVTNCYYRSARATEIVTGEVTSYSYAKDGTKLATLEQVTEWQVVVGVSTELLSADTTVTYQHPKAWLLMDSEETQYDASGNAKHEYQYIIFYGPDIYKDSVYTRCSITGNIS